MTSNKYSQNCDVCGSVVKAGEGVIEKNPNHTYGAKEWLVYHLQCFLKLKEDND
jgi:hypothetical protein